MNIVFVRLKASREKLNCFQAPDGMIIPAETNVLCQTVHGPKRGLVMENSIEGPEATGVAEHRGATLPLQPIIGIYQPVAIHEIRLPWWAWSSIPANGKLEKRMREYLKHGNFSSTIEIRQSDKMLRTVTPQVSGIICSPCKTT